MKTAMLLLGSLSLALILSAGATGQRQQGRVIALLRDANVKALNLTAEQQAAIRKILDTARAEHRVLFRRAQSGDGDRREFREQAMGLREKAWQSALTKLSDTQRKTWEKIGTANSRPGRRQRPQRGPRDLGLDDIHRVTPSALGRRGGTGLRIFKTEPHAVATTGYLVLTDHVDAIALSALDRLAAHHDGHVLKITDLAALAKNEDARDALRDRIREDAPRFVAIAPRLMSYRENMVLSMWEILSHLDDDPQLDVFPGFLVASTPKSLAALVDRSIAYHPLAKNELRAFAIAEIPEDLLYKSYESSALVKKILATKSVTMGDLTIPASEDISARGDYPEILGAGRFEIRKKNRRDLLDAFPKGVQSAIEDAAMLWILGHGKPGMACCAKVSAYTDMDLSNKIIFCGACFAGSAPHSDLFAPRTRGGEKSGDKPRFALKAIDDGSLIVIANMAISRGVHFMLPVLEGCLDGLSVGEAFQRVVNAQLGEGGFEDAYVAKPVRGVLPRNMPAAARRANQLVNVLIGDPAIRPFSRLR